MLFLCTKYLSVLTDTQRDPGIFHLFSESYNLQECGSKINRFLFRTIIDGLPGPV